jgi:putative NADH-flavin reductase
MQVWMDGRSGILHWFLISPALLFGDFAPGQALGRYRVGGDILLPADNGITEISGSDFGVAFVDEIDQDSHRRERFAVAA